MKDRETNIYHSDPFDLDNFYTDLIGERDRAHFHKVVARKSSVGGMSRLVLLPDSEPTQKEDIVVQDLKTQPLLETLPSGKQIIHTHSRDNNRITYTYKDIRYAGQVQIFASLRAPNGNE